MAAKPTVLPTLGQKGALFNAHQNFITKFMPQTAAPTTVQTVLAINAQANAIHAQIVQKTAQHNAIWSEIESVIMNTLSGAKVIANDIIQTFEKLITPQNLATINTLLAQSASVAGELASLYASFHASVAGA